MIKRILLLGFIFFNIVSAQIGYVEVTNPIYNFLDRMNSLHIIENYNSFEIPKTRIEISKFLKKINIEKNELNSIDQLTLNDFLIEFEFDLSGSVNNSYGIFNDKDDKPFFNDGEKYLYYYNDTSKFNTFINLVGSGEYLYSNNKLSNINSSTSLFTFGGEIRGTIFNHFGYFARATNGLQFGDKKLASFKSNLKYNYKYNSDHDSSKFFDETIGYFSAEFDYIKFKIGRDRVNIGYGFSKVIMDNYFPQMDYLSMQINYSIFSFSFIHGKLFGNSSEIGSKISGNQRIINDKYIAYHHLEINFSKHLQFGLGETIVYANRNMDLSYLNPFNFYKSAEHANMDRDNSMMFFDFRNNSLKGLSIFFTFLIDDVDFSKLGTDWYGNKFVYDFGFTYEPVPEAIPLTFGFQYLRIDPYVYAHRFADNNYTSMDFGIGPNIQPNSESYYFDIKFTPYYRLDIDLSYQRINHGANVVDIDENVITNYGGDILLGHRIWDSDDAIFLDGAQETTNHYIFSVKYEPLNNYLFTFQTDFITVSKNHSTNNNQIISNLIFSIRI